MSGVSLAMTVTVSAFQQCKYLQELASALHASKQVIEKHSSDVELKCVACRERVKWRQTTYTECQSS